MKVLIVGGVAAGTKTAAKLKRRRQKCGGCCNHKR